MNLQTDKILKYCFSAFLFIAGTIFLIRSCNHAHAAEDWMLRLVPDASYEIYLSTKRPGQKTVDELKEEWRKELDMHKREGQRCYDEAKEKCWWLPDVSDRKRARDCFQAFIASLGGSTMTGGLCFKFA